MHTTQPVRSNHASSAKRAFGAIVFSCFGALLLEIWGKKIGASIAVFILVASIGFVLAFTAYLRYRHVAPALAQELNTPAERQADRVFNLVNIGQWLVILILGNVFANVGLVDWVVPMGIFVIGLHFLPLAYVFRNPSHYVLGAALISFAAIYPFSANRGPNDPIGFLGTGLILWLAALWALRSSQKH
jgi:hypothetical protein